MDIKPMTTDEIRDALVGGEHKPEVRAVMALLKGLEIQSQDGIRIGQPDEERRDVTSMMYAYQEAQDTVITAITEANKRSGAGSA